MLPSLMRQRDAETALRRSSLTSSGGQLPVPPTLYTPFPTLPLLFYIIRHPSRKSKRLPSDQPQLCQPFIAVEGVEHLQHGVGTQVLRQIQLL